MNLLKLKSHKEINKSYVHTSIENDKNDFTKVNSKSKMLTRKRSYTNWRECDSSIETILNDLKDHSFEKKANHFLELF